MSLSERYAIIAKILRMAQCARSITAAADYRAIAAELLVLAMDERRD